MTNKDAALFEVANHRHWADQVINGAAVIERVAPCEGKSHWRFFRKASSGARDAMESSQVRAWLEKALGEGVEIGRGLHGKPTAVLHALKFKGHVVMVQNSLLGNSAPWSERSDVRWGVLAPKRGERGLVEASCAAKDFWAEFCFLMKEALEHEPEKFLAKIEREAICGSVARIAPAAASKRLRI